MLQLITRTFGLIIHSTTSRDFVVDGDDLTETGLTAYVDKVNKRTLELIQSNLHQAPNTKGTSSWSSLKGPDTYSNKNVKM